MIFSIANCVLYAPITLQHGDDKIKNETISLPEQHKVTINNTLDDTTYLYINREEIQPEDPDENDELTYKDIKTECTIDSILSGYIDFIIANYEKEAVLTAYDEYKVLTRAFEIGDFTIPPNTEIVLSFTRSNISNTIKAFSSKAQIKGVDFKNSEVYPIYTTSQIALVNDTETEAVMSIPQETVDQLIAEDTMAGTFERTPLFFTKYTIQKAGLHAQPQIPMWLLFASGFFILMLLVIINISLLN